MPITLQTTALKYKDGEGNFLGINGLKGDSGVHVGASAPSDPEIKVWIDTDGESDGAQDITPQDKADIAAIVSSDLASAANENQIPIADGNGGWTWGGNYNDLIDSLNRINVYLGSVESLTWAERMNYVRRGFGPDMFPVGTEFTTQHSRFGPIVWEVVDHDHYINPENPSGHTMTLLGKYVSGLTISNKEQMPNIARSLFTVTNNTLLPAGNYKFLCKWRSGVTSDNDKTFYFALQNPIVPGGQIRFYSVGNGGTLTTANSLAAFQSPLATEPTELITPTLTPLQGAVDLSSVENGIFIQAGLAETTAFDYDDSDFHQWLNSSAGVGQWWELKTPVNSVPYNCGYAPCAGTVYQTQWPGFINELNEDFAECVIAADYYCKAQKWSYSHNPDEIYQVRAKFILPSMKELGFTGLETDLEQVETTLAYYLNATNTKRIKYTDQTGMTTANYMTRTPCTANENRYGWKRYVNKSGDYDRWPPASGGFPVMCTLG